MQADLAAHKTIRRVWPLAGASKQHHAGVINTRRWECKLIAVRTRPAEQRTQAKEGHDGSFARADLLFFDTEIGPLGDPKLKNLEEGENQS